MAPFSLAITVMMEAMRYSETSVYFYETHGAISHKLSSLYHRDNLKYHEMRLLRPVTCHVGNCANNIGRLVINIFTEYSL
jgi:hypothetical protein